MIYVFECEACNESFEENLPIDDNQKPLKKPCPLCGVKGKVYRNFSNAGLGFQSETSYEGMSKKAGQGWKDTLSRIHEKAGRKSTLGEWL